jgi:hypothetical protein
MTLDLTGLMALQGLPFSTMPHCGNRSYSLVMTEHGAVPPIATVARFARAAWFFGNAYEAVVAVPQLIASAKRQPGVLATGSPARYFAPIAPAAVGGTAAVLIQSWRTGGDRRAIVASTATLGAALGLSAYLIASINVPLLRGEIVREAQPRLISRWHLGNAVRLGLLAVTEILVRRVEASASRKPSSEART